MIIVGITGPISHGKTTFGNLLGQIEPNHQHFESSDIIAEVANAWHGTLKTIPGQDDLSAVNEWLRALPAVLSKCVHTDTDFSNISITQEVLADHPVEYEKLLLHLQNLASNPALAHQEITNENKELYRPILQWLGGYLVQKVDGGIWYNEIVRRIDEARTKGCNMCIVGGLRFPPDARILKKAGAVIIKLYRPHIVASDLLDPTERERDSVPVDAVIENDGSIEDLAKGANQFYSDLQNGRLQPNYRCSALTPQA